MEVEGHTQKNRAEVVLEENFLLGREAFLYILSLFLESVRTLLSFLQQIFLFPSHFHILRQSFVSCIATWSNKVIYHGKGKWLHKK